MNIESAHENFLRCLEALRRDDVIAYPTEAVYGLGCNPDSEAAVIKLLALKQRLVEKGLILIAGQLEQLEPYIAMHDLSVIHRERLLASWPGPVTWLVPIHPQTPKWLTGSFDTLAVRVTDHPSVKMLCSEFGKPLVSTSANLSGLPPCRNSNEIQEQFGSMIPVLQGKTGGRACPSEIRDLCTNTQIRQG